MPGSAVAYLMYAGIRSTCPAEAAAPRTHALRAVILPRVSRRRRPCRPSRRSAAVPRATRNAGGGAAASGAQHNPVGGPLPGRCERGRHEGLRSAALRAFVPLPSVSWIFTLLPCLIADPSGASGTLTVHTPKVSRVCARGARRGGVYFNSGLISRQHCRQHFGSISGSMSSWLARQCPRSQCICIRGWRMREWHL